MTRLYISGPVTGIENDNFEAFREANLDLDRAGYAAYIPHDFVAEGADWHEAMLASIHELTDIRPGPNKFAYYEGVALLPGWEHSEGAKLEKSVAEACGIPVKTVDEWLEEAI